MKRLQSAACCALLPLVTWAQSPRPGPPSACPGRPADCQVSTPIYNFGRHEMTTTSSPIYSEGTVTVTCTRAAGQGFQVTVSYDLRGLPNDTGRVMRNTEFASLRYDLFVDAGRRRYWGDGSAGTSTISDTIDLNDNNRVVTHTHELYGTVEGQQSAEPGQWLGFVSARLEYTIERCR
jgi:spore coat protein U-like protein